MVALLLFSAFQLGKSLTRIQYNNGHISYTIDHRTTDLYKTQIKNFEFIFLYPSYAENRHKFKSDTEYEKYVDFIKKDIGSCSNCHRDCCSWCKHCNVVHSTMQCETKLWKIIKEKYSTWRTNFPNNEVLSGHEGAIYRSHFDPISDSLPGRSCPCQEISHAVNTTEAVKIFDSRTLTEHIVRIKSLNTF
jgi:hypothetical protein